MRTRSLQGNPFQTSSVSRPSRSKFDLSHTKSFVSGWQDLHVCCLMETIPGDHFLIDTKVQVRLQPLVAPIMEDIFAYVEFYYVPYRLLWSKFQRFITGSWNASDQSAPLFPKALVRQFDTSPRIVDASKDPSGVYYENGDWTLWSDFGFPDVSKVTVDKSYGTVFDFGVSVLPFRAYYRIYEEWYASEFISDRKGDSVKAAVDSEDEWFELFEPASTDSRYAIWDGFNVVRPRAWEHDYFTASLPWQQKGSNVGLNLSFPQSNATFPRVMAVGNGDGTIRGDNYGYVAGTMTVGDKPDVYSISNIASGTDAPVPPVPKANGRTDFRVDMKDFLGNTSIPISVFREAMAMQRFLETNARVGTRYTEFLSGHYGVSPRDETLQRSQFIGGTVFPIHVSEVLQTSSTDSKSPQGNMAGHGVGVDVKHVASHFCTEHGIIMGLMSIMPRSKYYGGINRQWHSKTKYDFFFPEFQHLSEQAILTREFQIFNLGEYATTKNAEALPDMPDKIFGYIGMYDHYRYQPSVITASLAHYNLGSWTTARLYEPVATNIAPAISRDVIYGQVSSRVFAVQEDQGVSFPNFIVECGNKVIATRPITRTAIPK